MAKGDETTSHDPTADAERPSPIERAKRIVEWVKQLKPVRVLQNFSDNHGNLLASGLSFLSIFALFAGIWVGFSVAGFVLNANPDIRRALFEMLNQVAPGLIGDDGAIKPSTLTESTALSWTGAIALVGLIFTGLGWLNGMRQAVRSIFELPRPTTNAVLLKIKDLAFGVGFGMVLLISAALSLFSTAALQFVFDLVGLGDASTWLDVAGRVVGALLMLAIDTTVFAVLFRVLAGVHIPLKHLLWGSLFGGIALGVLKLLGSALLGGASRNPLLASFAVIIGLLIWFNLISRVILLTASWIAVGLRDDGIAVRRPTPDELEERQRQARLTVAKADLEAAEREAERRSGIPRLLAGFRVRAAQRRLRDVVDRQGLSGVEATPGAAPAKSVGGRQ